MPDPADAPYTIRRLIVCFDGTWNTPEDQTNVSRIYAAIADVHARCPDQLKFYDPGVGTSTGTRLTGGALGWGLDDNIRQAYAWLINEFMSSGPAAPETDGQVFDAGPDIFIFGFSRGAFTARSLAGLINRCGVLKRDLFVGETEPLTHKIDNRAHPGSALVQQAWDLYQKEFPPGLEGRTQPECVEFRRQHAWTVKLHCLAVWDTVGALGVPMFSNTPLSRLRYGFHDTALGRVVEHAYHAVAIDEQREDYQVTLWDSLHAHGTRDVEQRWFPGAHANVGGGYQDDLLPDPPLRWIADKARALGLEFNDEFAMQLGRAGCKTSLPEAFKLRGDEYLSPVRDSYAEFLHGVYGLARGVVLKGRYWRPMLTTGVCETIDETAHMKWAADVHYRPRNFANAGRRD